MRIADAAADSGAGPARIADAVESSISDLELILSADYSSEFDLTDYLTRDSADAVVWKEISRDATSLMAGVKLDVGIAGELWTSRAIGFWANGSEIPNGMPQWIAGKWRGLKEVMLSSGGGLEVWVDWYDNLLHGRHFDKTVVEMLLLEGLEFGKSSVPDLSEERPTPIHFEFYNGALHRAPPRPPKLPEDRRATTTQA